MASPGEKPDRADQAFEALLAARARAAGPHVSDADFNRLLAEFRTLERPADAAPAAAIETPDPTEAHPVRAAADALARAGARLARLPRGPAFDEAVRELEHLSARVQLALARGAPDRFVLVRVVGHTVAFALADVLDVLGGVEACTLAEREGLKRLPAAAWWQGRETPGAEAGVWLLVQTQDRRAVLGVDACLGVHAGRPAPLAGVWAGARGLRGLVAIEDQDPAFAPDLTALLKQQARR